MSTNNAPKYAFFYMLSLVALVFMSIATGMIIFQIINKLIPDVPGLFQGSFSDEQLKFAISALVISVPIFFLTIRQIFKSIDKGDLQPDSAIRRWLTYFILFVSSVVMIGWLIGTLNNFLDGELTAKFLLKAVAAIGIAASIFTFYLYDIRRKSVPGQKDRTINMYFYGSLIVIIAAFAASLFIVESPTQARNRRLDDILINNFNQIDSAVSTYYQEYGSLPENLDVLKTEFSYLGDENLRDPATNAPIQYRTVDERTYELCASFLTDTTENEGVNAFIDERWRHASGEQCLKQAVHDLGDNPDVKRPIPVN